jgi:hypothetical protein
MMGKHTESPMMGDSIVRNLPNALASSTNTPVQARNLPNEAPVGDFVGAVSISDKYSSEKNIFDTKPALIATVAPASSNAENAAQISTDEKTASYRDARPIAEIQREAGMYASLFDGKQNKRWMGALVRCIQQYPPHIRHLAAIDTLYHTYFPDWRKKPYSPGAWFTKACAQYVKGIGAPRAVQLWAETELPYHEIEAALQQGRQTPLAVPLPFTTFENMPEQPHTSSQVQHQPSQREAQRMPETANPSSRLPDVREHSHLATSMSREEAERLCERILREGEPYGIQAIVQPGTEQGWAVVSIWEGIPVEQQNESAWISYFAACRSCLKGLEQLGMQRTSASNQKGLLP